MKKLLAFLTGLAIAAVAMAQPYPVNNGGYPTATTLVGTERILAYQSGKTVNILPTQLVTFMGSVPQVWSGTQFFLGSPSFSLNNASAPANQKNTILTVNSSGSLVMSTATDLQATLAVTNLFACTRSGTAVLNCSYGNATDNPTFSFLGTGAATFGGSLTAVSSNVGTAVTGAPYGIDSAVGSGATFQFAGTTGTSAVGAETRWTNDTFGPVFMCGKSRGASVNTQTIVVSGDQLCRFLMGGSDGSIIGTFAGLYGYAEGTPVAGSSYPGQLCMQTTPALAVATVKVLCAHQDGGVTIASNTDQGPGSINATAYFIAGVSLLQTPGPFRTVAGTTDTLAATDCQGTVRYTSASATTVTVPASTLAVNCIVTLIADGAAMTVTGSSLTLQLGGTTTTGNRAVVNGGMATLNTVATNKAFVAGPGVS